MNITIQIPLMYLENGYQSVAEQWGLGTENIYTTFPVFYTKNVFICLATHNAATTNIKAISITNITSLVSFRINAEGNDRAYWFSVGV